MTAPSRNPFGYSGISLAGPLAGKHTRGLAMVKESESLPLWVWLALGLIAVGSGIYVIMAFAIEHMMAVMQ